MKFSILISSALLFAVVLVGVVQGQEVSEKIIQEVQPVDLCENVKCEIGEECFEGKCRCAASCDTNWEGSNRQICVDKVKTYNHLCDFNRHKCYCRNNEPGCKSAEFGDKSVSDSSFVYYYGPCKDLAPECNWEQWETNMLYVMRNWFDYLLNYKWGVANSLSNEIDDTLVRPFNSKARSKAQSLTMEAPETRKGKIVSYWFCEIDRDNDGSLSQKELARLTQILLPSNSCVDQFFAKCANKPTLSYADWSGCFNLSTEDQVQCADYSD